MLIITTRQTRRWTIPKGWPIKGLHARRVAEKEAWEEAGVKGRAKKKPVGHFTYQKILADGRAVIARVMVPSCRRQQGPCEVSGTQGADDRVGFS